MKKLILESIEDVLTDEQKKWVDETRRSGKTIPDAWFDEHEVIVTRAYNGDLFKSIKSREELYKFLRDTCNIDFINEILEIPESLESLNIDERFIDAFNGRMEGERILKYNQNTKQFDKNYTDKEIDKLVWDCISVSREYFYSNSPKKEHEFDDVVINEDDIDDFY